MTYEAILSEAMALPAEQRVDLLKDLADSLSSKGDEVESAWGLEVGARVTALRAGRLETVPASEALARAEASLRNRRA